MTTNSFNFTGILGSFVSHEVSIVLPEATYPCKLVAMTQVDSFTAAKYNKETQSFEFTEKEEKKAYTDSTPELLVMLEITSGPKKGKLIPHRFNFAGFFKEGDFTSEELKKNKYRILDGYVCRKNEAGKVVRVQSEEKLAQAMNVFNSFFTCTMGNETGKNINDLAVAMVEGIAKVNCKLIIKQYGDGKVNDVKGFLPYNEDVVSAESSNIEEKSLAELANEPVNVDEDIF